MKNTLIFTLLLFLCNLSAQNTKNCWGILDSDRVALRLYPIPMQPPPTTQFSIPQPTVNYRTKTRQ